MVANILLADTSDPGDRVIRSNSTFLEQCHVAYQSESLNAAAW